MGKQQSKELFAPLPARALKDTRLTARHFRVLAAVAFHDRFGKNGQGCWAGRKRLALETDCSETHVSDALGDLRALGYITSSPHPMNRRTKVHRVLYNDDDLAMSVSVHNPDRSRKQDPSNSSDDADRSRAPVEQVPTRIPKGFKCKENGLSNILGINLRKYSAEAAPERGLSIGVPVEALNETTAYLSDVESALKSDDPLVRSSVQYECERLSGIIDSPALPEATRLAAANLRTIARELAGK